MRSLPGTRRGTRCRRGCPAALLPVWAPAPPPPGTCTPCSHRHVSETPETPRPPGPRRFSSHTSEKGACGGHRSHSCNGHCPQPGFDICRHVPSGTTPRSHGGAPRRPRVGEGQRSVGHPDSGTLASPPEGSSDPATPSRALRTMSLRRRPSWDGPCLGPFHRVPAGVSTETDARTGPPGAREAEGSSVGDGGQTHSVMSPRGRRRRWPHTRPPGLMPLHCTPATR